jgi:hypothetical protein
MTTCFSHENDQNGPNKSETLEDADSKLGEVEVGKDIHKPQIGRNRPSGGPFGEWVKIFAQLFFHIVCFSALYPSQMARPIIM